MDKAAEALIHAAMNGGGQGPQMVAAGGGLNDVQVICLMAASIHAPTNADRVAEAMDIMAEAIIQMSDPMSLNNIANLRNPPPLFRMVQAKMIAAS